MDNKDISLVTEKQRIPLSGGGEIGYIVTLPNCDALKEMTEFYIKVEENCRRFCENELVSSLENTAHYYRYRIQSQTKTERDVVKVFIKVILTDRSEARVIEHREMTHIWKYGMLIKAK